MAENTFYTFINLWTTMKFGCQDQLFLKKPRKIYRVFYFVCHNIAQSKCCILFSPDNGTQVLIYTNTFPARKPLTRPPANMVIPPVGPTSCLLFNDFFLTQPGLRNQTCRLTLLQSSLIKLFLILTQKHNMPYSMLSVPKQIQQCFKLQGWQWQSVWLFKWIHLKSTPIKLSLSLCPNLAWKLAHK